MAGAGTKRIVDLTEAPAVQNGDYIAIDSTARGTKKTPASVFAKAADLTAEQTVRQQADEAEAQARTQAISAEQTAREEADNALTSAINSASALIQNPTKTLSGALCSFTDGADMPAKSVVVNIEPQQSGTGTPSPDNVRQISGWESVNVNVTGVNVWDEEVELGGLIWADGQPLPANDRLRSKNFAPCTPNTTYHVFNARAGSVSIAVFFYDASQAFISYTVNTDFTTPSNARYFKLVIQNTTADNHDISINYPSTDHEYHAYNPNSSTTPINLGRTVYGSTLDVVSGVLTAYPFYPSYNGETLGGRWICDRAVYAEGTTPPTGSQVALISGTGTTYQLTPTEVSTLLGENNVWADAGAVEVTYRRDINLALEQLEALLNS